jgi:hypothetical protein
MREDERVQLDETAREQAGRDEAQAEPHQVSDGRRATLKVYRDTEAFSPNLLAFSLDWSNLRRR